MVLTLEEAARGLDTSLSVERRVSCPRCQGDGAEPGSPRQTCSRCQGKGQVSQSKGLLKIFNTCPDCQGAGAIITSPCSACQGAGVINEKKQIQVHIPPGVDTGTRLRLRGEGEAGTHGAPPGDLYLEMCVAPHPIFTRKHKDLYYRAPISFVEAALGTEVEVPTLTAPTRLAIPPGTQPGATLRIPGLGLPGLRGKSAGRPGGGRGPPNPHPALGAAEATPPGVPQAEGYRGIGRVQGDGSLKGISRICPPLPNQQDVNRVSAPLTGRARCRSE